MKLDIACFPLRLKVSVSKHYKLTPTCQWKQTILMAVWSPYILGSLLNICKLIFIQVYLYIYNIHVYNIDNLNLSLPRFLIYTFNPKKLSSFTIVQLNYFNWILFYYCTSTFKTVRPIVIPNVYLEYTLVIWNNFSCHEILSFHLINIIDNF